MQELESTNKSGIKLKKNIKIPLSSKRKKVIKVFLCLLLINTFFFLLLAPEKARPKQIRENYNELYIIGDLKTTFSQEKKVMLVSDDFSLKMGPVYLQDRLSDEADEKVFLIEIPDEWDEDKLKKLASIKWNIFPYNKNMKTKFSHQTKRKSYEVRY